LELLHIQGTQVTDLKPVARMPLQQLVCSHTKVADLSPLAGMKLVFFNCEQSAVTDLSVLKQMPVKEVHCDFVPERDTAILRSIKTLEKINDKPTAEFLKQATTAKAAFEQWLTNTRKLPAEKQVDAVAAKLKELNPGFQGTVTPITE